MCPYADGPEAPGNADHNVVVKITGTQHVQRDVNRNSVRRTRTCSEILYQEEGIGQTVTDKEGTSAKTWEMTAKRSWTMARVRRVTAMRRTVLLLITWCGPSFGSAGVDRPSRLVMDCLAITNHHVRHER
jgi:hypothetical protein